MKWTEGHVWVSEQLLINSNHHFQYKYVIKSEPDQEIWESGLDRIADL
jgi:hypothetical protein